MEKGRTNEAGIHIDFLCSFLSWEINSHKLGWLNNLFLKLTSFKNITMLGICAYVFLSMYHMCAIDNTIYVLSSADTACCMLM